MASTVSALGEDNKPPHIFWQDRELGCYSIFDYKFTFAKVFVVVYWPLLEC